MEGERAKNNFSTEKRIAQKCQNKHRAVECRGEEMR
jgi:hypothetical protein